jgi:WD40 repeat protein
LLSAACSRVRLAEVSFRYSHREEVAMAAKVAWLACCLVLAARCIDAEAEPSESPLVSGATSTVVQTVNAEVLPSGAISRFGTTRFRAGEENQVVGVLPDNRTVVLTKSDGRLQHLDLQTGRLRREARLTKSEVSAAAPTADGRYVAALGQRFDKVQRKYINWVALLDAKTGEESVQHELDGDPDVRLIAVADNATVIALIGKDAILIDLARGTEIPWPMDRVPFTSAVALSPDGNLLAVGSPGLVRVWKWRESKQPRYFEVPGKDARKRANIGSIEFSPDGSQMAVGVHGGSVSLIDLGTGKEVRRFAIDVGDARRANDFHHLAFAREGQLLASPYSSSTSSGVAVWEVASGKLVKRLEPESGGVGPIAFSSDAQWLVGVRNFGLRVWNVNTGELLGQNLAGHASAYHPVPA